MRSSEGMDSRTIDVERKPLRPAVIAPTIRKFSFWKWLLIPFVIGMVTLSHLEGLSRVMVLYGLFVAGLFSIYSVYNRLTIQPEILVYFIWIIWSLSGAIFATPTMTAEGLLCRMYLGWRKDDPGLGRGVEWLVGEHLPRTNEPNVYYWYYATQVFHHFGDVPWRTWNEKMRDVLVSSQIDAGPNAGSWDPHHDPWGRTGGRIFQTSLSACTLEVYYCHAPIYRQIKLD